MDHMIDELDILPTPIVAGIATLEDLLARYIAEITPHKKSAVTESQRIKAIMRREIAGHALAALRSADLAAYRDERLETVAPATVARELKTIRHAIDIGRREWGIDLPENPAKLVTLPAEPESRDRRLTSDEEARLHVACDSLRNPCLRPLIILSIETAMQRGELLSLLWEHIDWDRRIARVPQAKLGGGRNVPLTRRAYQTLVSLREDVKGDRVFPTTAKAVGLAWEHLRVRAACPDLNFQDLRHEALSRLFEKGLTIAQVATISGHREPRVLQRYIRPTSPASEAAVPG